MSVSMEPLDSAARSGRVAAVHGSVVDIAFAGGMLPAISEAVAIEWDIGPPLVAEVQQHLGPAMVRYANDAYFDGNPWYLATLAAAEFYFNLATALQSGAEMLTTSENERFRRRLGGESPAAGALERGDDRLDRVGHGRTANTRRFCRSVMASV